MDHFRTSRGTPSGRFRSLLSTPSPRRYGPSDTGVIVVWSQKIISGRAAPDLHQLERTHIADIWDL